MMRIYNLMSIFHASVGYTGSIDSKILINTVFHHLTVEAKFLQFYCKGNRGSYQSLCKKVQVGHLWLHIKNNGHFYFCLFDKTQNVTIVNIICLLTFHVNKRVRNGFLKKENTFHHIDCIYDTLEVIHDVKFGNMRIQNINKI